MERVHRSRIDGWVRLALLAPLVVTLVPAVAGLLDGKRDAVLVSLATWVGYGLLLWGVVLPLTYHVTSDRLIVRAGRLRWQVPWDRLDRIERSSNPLSSPALSLRRLRITYRKPGGRETWLLISPADRDAFLADVAAASPAHRVVDGVLVRR